MGNRETYLQLIQSVAPTLDVTNVSFAGGQTHDVVIVADALVFRFARGARAAGAMRREVALLRALQGRLPLAIPTPRDVRLESAAGAQAFFSYERLPGSPLSRRVLAVRDGDDDSLRALIVQLASFLIALHRVPAESVLPEASGSRSIAERWQDLHGRIVRRLYPLMRPDARDEVTAHFESLLTALRAGTVQPVLVHGDFGAGNILVQPETLAPVAVIDFSSAGHDDPAVDWAALSTLHPSALRVVAERYPWLEPELRRVPLYRATFALQEALIGVEQGDQAAVRSGLAAYV